MCLFQIVFVVFVVTNYIYVCAEDEETTEYEIQEVTTEPLDLDDPTFVALIDIQFEDGSNRSCSATIIHENAVLTAAHCFMEYKKKKEIEMSSSFVIIGSKKKIKSGDEIYLPIERVIIHPKYRGWTADIALVHTFASMTNDNPGSVLPIKEDSTSTPVKSNVTVLSWKNSEDQKRPPYPDKKAITKDDCYEDDDDTDSVIRRPASKDYYRSRSPLRYKTTRKGPFIGETRSREPNHLRLQSLREEKSSSASPEIALITNLANANQKPNSPNKVNKPNDAPNKPQETIEPNRSIKLNARNEHDVPNSQEPIKPDRSHKTDESNESDETNKSQKIIEPNRSFKPNAPKESRELDAPNSPRELDTPNEPHERDAPNESYELGAPKESRELTAPNQSREPEAPKEFRKPNANNDSPEFDPSTVSDGLERQINKEEDEASLRRHLYGEKFLNVEEKKSKGGELNIETFGIVNVNNCKKLVDDALPSIFSINPKEFVCYENKHQHVNDADSGAPVVYEGRMVAMTLGGLKYGVEHIGVGLKVNCFCSWIAENLPAGGNKMECSGSCCDYEEDQTLRSKKYVAQPLNSHNKAGYDFFNQ